MHSYDVTNSCRRRHFASWMWTTFMWHKLWRNFVYNAVVTYEKSFLLYDNGIERNQKQFFSLQSLLADLLHSFALCSSAFKIFKALLHLLIVLFYCVFCAPICEDEKNWNSTLLSTVEPSIFIFDLNIFFEKLLCQKNSQGSTIESSSVPGQL